MSGSIAECQEADTTDSSESKMHVTPKAFYFVNKDPGSKSFSRSEPSTASEMLRHVQEHVWRTRTFRQDITRAGRALNLHRDPAPDLVASDTYSEMSACQIPNPSGCDLSRTKEFTLATESSPALRSEERMSRLSTTNSYSTSQARNERLSLPQITSTLAISPARVRKDLALHKTIGPESQLPVSPIVSRQPRTWSTPTLPNRSRVVEASVTRAANRVMRFPDNSPDPFACTAGSITQQIHICLVYFESLWISRLQALPHSPGRQLVRKSLSDELQMACIVAAMASRLENFHGIAVPGGSSRYMASAVGQLRVRLAEKSAMRSEDVYAILKLYVAEAYRASLDGALVHPNGAAAAYERVNDWKSFDLDMATTLCGTGEAFFLPQVWLRPATFKTIADPGPARTCFSHDPFWGINKLDPDDRLATSLISSFRRRGLESTQLDERLSILNDMTEYTKVRQKMLQIVAEGQMVPKDVACWAHLRRINLVFRLLSVDTTADSLSHCVRISLITWLAIVSDLNGFGRNLEIVASHLRDAIQSLTGSDMSTHSILVTWMMFLGAVTGTRSSDGPWFSRCLAEFLIKTGTVPEEDLKGWTHFMETVNEGFFYCARLQRKSVHKVASRLHSHSSDYFTKAGA